MRKAALQMVCELAEKDERVVFIGSDLGLGTMKEFQERFPDRFFMEGISEANLIGMAAGMAMEGKIPYINTIATFIVRRAFEQVCLDLGLHNLPVRLIANGGGLVYGPLGPTHEAFDDIALMRSIPNMSIVAPSDANEMRRLMPETLNRQGPIYIRLAKGHDPIVSKNDWGFSFADWYEYQNGSDLLLITTGIGLNLCVEASEKLKALDINCGIVHLPTLKPFDTGKCMEFLKKYPAVMTVEEHLLSGGLGTLVAETIAENSRNLDVGFSRIGLPDQFPEGYGKQLPLMESLGVSADAIVERAKTLVK
jgi:transketolase